jgi:hypothetical protein
MGVVSRALALGAVVAVLVAQWLARDHRPDFSDFKVYWVAGGKALEHLTVYDVQGHYQYKYSPFVAWLWAWPHALPGQRYQWALLHYAACCSGFLGVWFLLARVIDRARAFWLWLGLVLVFSIGLRDELKLGQANLWPFLCVLPAWFIGPRVRPRGDHGARGSDWRGFAIGALWAFAIQWKLYALILAPVWLLRRRVSVGVGALVFTLFSLFGVLALVHGPEFALSENVRWLRSLTASSEELLVSQYNVSTLGVLGKWGRCVGLSSRAWTYCVWLALLPAFAVPLWWAERSAETRNSPFLRFWSASWAWAFIVVLNPLVWPYWLLLCLPLFLAYVADTVLKSQRGADPTFIAVCGLFACANWFQNTSLVHNGLSLVAAAALLFDAQRRVRKRRQTQHASTSALPLSLSPTQRSH